MNVDEATLVLGIETSCDETAAALVMGGTDIVSSVVSTQVELHAEFGGVVPEIASRAHLQVLNPVIARAIVESGVDDARIDAVACTVGPGLVGALLVGVSAAKSLALAWDIPFVGVAKQSISMRTDDLGDQMNNIAFKSDAEQENNDSSFCQEIQVMVYGLIKKIPPEIHVVYRYS